MRTTAVAALVAISALAAPAMAAEMPLTTQMQVLCLPFAEGRRPLEDVIALAQRTGYPTRVTKGVFTDLSGSAGRLHYALMLDGRRSCSFERPQSAYRQIVADFKVWLGRVSGGPWVAPEPEGPDVEGERAMGWTGARASVEITEDYNAEDQIVLFVGARSKP
jgi:hypothetical protein